MKLLKNSKLRKKTIQLFRMALVFFIGLIFLPLGCSGYYLKKNSNPFEQYNIKKIYIPLFYNESNLPFASADLTNAFVAELTSIKGLSITTKKDDGADATLIGIFSSTPEMNKTYRKGSTKTASRLAPENIGDRQDFLVPTSTKTEFSLQIMLLRNATDDQIEYLLEQKSNPYINPELILSRTFGLSFSFEQDISNSEVRSINTVKTIGNRNFSFIVKSREVAQEFRTVVLSSY